MLPSLVIKNPFSPIVYIHWSDNECLYVGQSGQGLTRPFEKSHKMWSYRNLITHTDIYHVLDRTSAIALEKKFTKELNPKYDESFLAGYAGASYKRHMDRCTRPPKWVADNAKIDEYVKLRFSNNPEGATRNRELISLYYKENKTLAEVAEKLNMTVQAVSLVLRRIKLQMAKPMKPSHRLRKNGISIHQQ